MPILHILPDNITIEVPAHSNLITALHNAGVMVDAPCGGHGKCGKCEVLADEKPVRSCQTSVDRDMTVTIPPRNNLTILQTGLKAQIKIQPLQKGSLLAFDIGTTSVVCFLLDGNTGQTLASCSMQNPQTVFGADVISRIQAALAGHMQQETAVIRKGMMELIQKVCSKAEIPPRDIGVVSIVGNPCMQQLFLGIYPKNLSTIPFAPILTEKKIVSCAEYLPICQNAQLIIVPDISGYIGADTIGCILSTKMYQSDEMTLMVDIGTNGEMVLGNRNRMTACSTAAGPALEGANIHFGMRGTDGAIDHVWLENGSFQCSVIGSGKAVGICGSGLIDAVAVALRAGMINRRGKILTNAEIDGQKIIPLTSEIYLTQDDIQQMQLAKGAICAGITLMAQQLGISLEEIHRVFLAGAFGTFLNPKNACRIGLLPPELENKIIAVGNAAGIGAKILACDRELIDLSQKLTERIEFLELANLPQFPKIFAKSMRFQEEAL